MRVVPINVKLRLVMNFSLVTLQFRVVEKCFVTFPTLNPYLQMYPFHMFNQTWPQHKTFLALHAVDEILLIDDSVLGSE